MHTSSARPRDEVFFSQTDTTRSCIGCSIRRIEIILAVKNNPHRTGSALLASHAAIVDTMSCARYTAK